MPLVTSFFFFLLFSPIFVVSESKEERKQLLCAACLAVVDEIEWEIEQVDPKKKIQVGSFRVDPDGHQKGSYQVPYAGSESHMTEVLEGICTKMNTYALSTDPDSGKKSYVRTSSRRGEAVTLSNISMSGEVSERLKHDCNSLVEEFEDDLMEVFKTKDSQPKDTICQRITGYCPSSRDEL
ncbi:protein canopy homolog 2-like [Corticium candelabrum]|uniref:protein canopy homolog 2-like n=1 Tax=Corticium candelabrum TaxID=121492 RepID=UPI002E25B2BD|nr:protein canopy homolog 2-like [Corticium candelabrum]